MALLRCTVLMLAAGLAACASQGNPFERNSPPLPTNYKSDILAFLRTYLNDPTNVREGALTQPSLHRIGGNQRYIVCVRFNARKSDGQYAGVIDTAAVFHDNRLDRFVNLTPDETAPDASLRKELGAVCKTAAYQPFPELARLTR